MSTYAQIPFASLSKWVIDIVNITPEELLEYVPDPDDIAQVAMVLDLSDDPDKLMSAATSISYLIGKDENAYGVFSDIVNDLPDARWEDLIKMRADVARECIRLFNLLHKKPSTDLVEKISSIIVADLTCAEIFVEVWCDSRWSLTIEFVYSIQQSSTGWRLLHYANKIGYPRTSTKVLARALAHGVTRKSTCLLALIGTNGSALEYLMHIDNLNGAGIVQTIETINHFELWETILYNPAAAPIIDFILNNHTIVGDGLFESQEQLRDWIIPHISINELICRYITVDDISNVRVCFFINPFAIDLISEWINEGNCTYYVISGLVIIASSHHTEAAIKATKLIDQCLYWDENLLTSYDWERLLRGTHSIDYVFNKFAGRNDELLKLLRACEMIPYWDAPDGDHWELFNLTNETAKYIELDDRLRAQLAELVHLLTYSDWTALFTTDFGIIFGLNNIQHVVQEDALFLLVRSPLIPAEHIANLYALAEVTEYTNDEDILAIINRQDAFEIDKKKIVEVNANLCRELMVVWHDPTRLMRFAHSNNVDLRTYLSLL